MEQDNALLIDVEQALAEARELEHGQRRIAGRALQGSWITRLAMYAVGGLLVVTLAGVQIPSWGTTLLGVIVIVVTIVGQQFRPDVKFIIAKAHILQLRRMLTTAEKDLAGARSGDAAAPAPDEILAHVRAVVRDVERSQHLDYAIMRERIVSVMPRDAQVRDT